MEPSQLAGTAGAALGVGAVRAVPLRARWRWPLLVGVAAAVVTSCGRGERPVGYADARAVVDRRCLECHSERPTNVAFPIAPLGVMFDTAGQMQLHAPRIEARAVIERTMPLANIAGMTDEERRLLGRWVKNGAKVP